MPLTDVTCRTAKPKEKAYKLADFDGMYLEVLPSGGKYWRLKYRYAGKEKRLALGVYPEISLVEARLKRDAARKLLREGIDPTFAKQEEKRQIRLNAANTFEAIATEWLAHNQERWSLKHAKTILRRMEADIFPFIGNVPIKNITSPQILEVVRKIEQRSAHDIARRAIQYCSNVFLYAMRTGRADGNPCDAMKGALKPIQRGHYASLEINELPQFMTALYKNEARLFVQTKLAVEFMLLTFSRTNELTQAKWGEFDFNDRIWVIPAERMKMRKSHIVPLSKQALGILAELKRLNGHREHIFPGQRDPRKGMSNNTILMALSRMGYRSKMTGHGFRSLALSTIKERLNYRHEVVDRQLAHAHRNQVDAAYDRAKFLDERKVMMQDWADYLETLVQQDNVVRGYFGTNEDQNKNGPIFGNIGF